MASGSATGPDETGFVGEHDGLHTIASRGKLSGNPADAGLHGRLATRRNRSPVSVLLSPVAMRTRTSVSRWVSDSSRRYIGRIGAARTSPGRIRASGAQRPQFAPVQEALTSDDADSPPSGRVGATPPADVASVSGVTEYADRMGRIPTSRWAGAVSRAVVWWWCGSDDGATVDDGADRLEHLGQGVFLKSLTHRRATRAQNVIVIVEGGQHDDLRGPDRPLVGESKGSAGSLRYVDTRHPNVHEHDIGFVLPDDVETFPTVAGLSGDGEVG